MSPSSLAVLSHSRSFYSTRRLFEAAESRGLRPQLLDPTRVLIHAGPDGAWLSDDGQRVATPEVVIPRIGATLTEWSLAMLETLCQSGARSVVPPDAIRRASDKLIAQQLLVGAGLPTLPTVAVRESFHAVDAIAAVGGAPVVIKLPQGTQGKTVLTASDHPSALSTLAAFTAMGHVGLVQRRVAMPRARDLRVLVIGGKAEAACWRYAPEGDFRSNIHRGGRAEATPIDEATADLAERAAQVLGLPLCGVDLIERRQGQKDPDFAVLEVNGSPGIQGIEKATGRDLAGLIVASALRGS